MSRLHQMRVSLREAAAQFSAEIAPGTVCPRETVEGWPGLVVVETEGRRVLRNLIWGFPRRTRDGDQPSHLGLVADLTNPLWERLVVDPRNRCLIVLTHFANPGGVPGAKTRTWFSLKDQHVLAWAGFWRDTPEFGPVYAGMTMTANAAIPPTNDRMPVLLEPGDYDAWLHGGIADVIRFQFRPPVDAARMTVERSAAAWRSGKPPRAPSDADGAAPMSLW